MTVNWVQGKGTFNSSPGGTLGVTLTAAVTSGNTICGAVSFSTATGLLTSVTDDKGNTYNLEAVVNDPTNSQDTRAFSLSNITNGPSTITAHFATNASAASIIADEFSGCATAATDERDSTAHGGQLQASPGSGTDGITSGNFTTTTNGDLIYGVTSNDTGDDSGSDPAHGTGFALTGTKSGISSNTCAELTSEWLAQVTAGSLTAATFTQVTNVARITFMIAIKAAVVGTGGGFPTTIVIG